MALSYGYILPGGIGQDHDTGKVVRVRVGEDEGRVRRVPTVRRFSLRRQKVGVEENPDH